MADIRTELKQLVSASSSDPPYYSQRIEHTADGLGN